MLTVVFFTVYLFLSGISMSVAPGLPGSAPDGPSNIVGISRYSEYVWCYFCNSSGTVDTLYYKWVVTGMDYDSVFADIYESEDGGRTWKLSSQNVEIIHFDLNRIYFSIHNAGPFIVPVPLNVSSLIAQIEGTYASFVGLENTTWYWDGRNLTIYNNFVPDVGVTLENYTLKIVYDKDGVMLYWKETYVSLGKPFVQIIELVSKSTDAVVDKNTDAVNLPLFDGINTTLILRTSDTVNVSGAVIPVDLIPAALGTPPSNSAFIISVNVSDKSKINYPAELRIKCSSEDLGRYGLGFENTSVWIFEETEKKWVELDTYTDPEEGIITARVPHFSYFTLAVGNPGEIENGGISGYSFVYLMLSVGIISVIMLWKFYRLNTHAGNR